jgi:hypothetical protein
VRRRKPTPGGDHEQHQAAEPCAAHEVTTAHGDTSNAQDPGGRLMQMVARISW